MLICPSVSVVIPVYNGARFLAAALACVQNQNTPVEVIVIDDGSTDASACIAAEAQVRCISQSNAGPAAARNRGVQEASAEFVAFLDADDVWTPHALSVLLCSLQANPAADVAHGLVQCVHNGVAAGAPRRSTQVGSMLFRRAVFERVGGFDESLRYSEDTDWFLRAADSSAVVLPVDEVVLLYTVHDQSTTYGRAADELHIVPVLRAAIRRRRENPQV